MIVCLHADHKRGRHQRCNAPVGAAQARLLVRMVLWHIMRNICKRLTSYQHSMSTMTPEKLSSVWQWPHSTSLQFKCTAATSSIPAPHCQTTTTTNRPSSRGQTISSNQSHKSYRPLTVLAFRWTRQAWVLLSRLVPPLAVLPHGAAPSAGTGGELDAATSASGLPEGGQNEGSGFKDPTFIACNGLYGVS